MPALTSSSSSVPTQPSTKSEPVLTPADPAADPLHLLGSLLAFVAIVVVAIAVWFAGTNYYRLSDPYVRDVLASEGNPEQGEAIFQINCAGCHGDTAEGYVGPSLQAISQHKSRFELIHQVTSGDTPPMPKFQPSSQEMADLLSYLEQI